MASKLQLMAKARRRRAEAEQSEGFQPRTIEETEGYDPFTFENIVGSAVEPMLQLGTGAAGMVAGGVAGLGAMGNRALGFDTGDPAEVVKSVQEAMTYQPRTRGGQTVSEAIAVPMESLVEKTEFTGQQAADYTGSPAYGAVTNALLQAAPMAMGAKYAPSGKPLIPSWDSTLTAPARATKAVANAIAKSGKNIFPRHKERTGRVLDTLAGKDFDSIVSALERAEAGETAGQATTGVGRSEFSAMDKLMAGREPTTYGPTGRIREAQQAGRAEELGGVAGTSEELTAAIKKRAEKADPLYKAARGAEEAVDVAPIVSSVDKLITENPGNSVLLTELAKVKKGLTDKEGNIRTNAQEVLSTVDGLKTAIANKDNAFIKGELTNIKDSIIEAVPGYKQAQEVFRVMSKPVNQMQIGKILEKALEPRLGSKDRVTVFVNAIENAKKLIKKETGQDLKLSEVLSEEQLAVVNKTREQINRDVTLKEKGTEGYKKLNKVLGDELAPIEAPGMLSSKMMIFRNLMKRLKGHAGEKTMDYLSANWDKPKEIAKIMREFKPNDQAAIQEYLNTRNKLITGSAIGAAENQ